MPPLGPALHRPQSVGDNEERELSRERRSLDMRHEVRRQEKRLVGRTRRTSASAAHGSPVRRSMYRLVQHDELVSLERQLHVADDARIDTAAKKERLVAYRASSRTSVRPPARAARPRFAPSAGNTAHPTLPSISTVDAFRPETDVAERAAAVPTSAAACSSSPWRARGPRTRRRPRAPRCRSLGRPPRSVAPARAGPCLRRGGRGRR